MPASMPLNWNSALSGTRNGHITQYSGYPQIIHYSFIYIALANLSFSGPF
jgi:hypothetical protein